MNSKISTRTLPIILAWFLLATSAASGPAALTAQRQGTGAVLVADLAESVPIAGELLGQSLDMLFTRDLNPGSSGYHTASLAGSLRGPVGGLFAQIYDWQDPLGLDDVRRHDDGEPEWESVLGSLGFLRVSREAGAVPVFTVNTNGISNRFFWPVHPARNPYITNDAAALAEMAADWVHYTNYTLQHFDQSAPPDPQAPGWLEAHSASILDAIYWQDRDGTAVQDTLPFAGEQVPPVLHWEIGNEPNFAIGGFRLSPEQFARRYYTVTQQMLARDLLITGRGSPSIQVGPSLMNLHPPEEHSIAAYIAALQDIGAPIDFISYHPYTNIFGSWYWDAQGKAHTMPFPDKASHFSRGDIELLQRNLSNIYVQQQSDVLSIAQAITGPIELRATEWNPSSWESSFYLTWRGQSMAQSLGVVETIFSFARLGLTQAHFHTNPAFGSALENPTYQTFVYLRESLGDRLLASYDGGDPAGTQMRAYVTHQSDPERPDFAAIRLWGLNWGDSEQRIQFQVAGLDQAYTIDRVCTMAAPSLLHGASGEEDSPADQPMDEPLSINCSLRPGDYPAGGSWDTRISLGLALPPYSWTAYTLVPVRHDLSVGPPGIPMAAHPGGQVTHRVVITNTGNLTDTFHVDLSGQRWAAAGATRISLARGQTFSLPITVTVPPDAADGQFDRVTVSVQGVQTSASIQLQTVSSFPEQYMPLVRKDVDALYGRQITAATRLVRRIAVLLSGR